MTPPSLRPLQSYCSIKNCGARCLSSPDLAPAGKPWGLESITRLRLAIRSRASHCGLWAPRLPGIAESSREQHGQHVTASSDEVQLRACRQSSLLRSSALRTSASSGPKPATAAGNPQAEHQSKDCTMLITMSMESSDLRVGISTQASTKLPN